MLGSFFGGPLGPPIPCLVMCSGSGGDVMAVSLSGMYLELNGFLYFVDIVIVALRMCFRILHGSFVKYVQLFLDFLFMSFL